jgi:TnpA family transposase
MVWANLQPTLTRPINWEIIEQQSDELIKLATALQLGTAYAESMLRRFHEEQRRASYLQFAVRAGQGQSGKAHSRRLTSGRNRR